MFYFLHIYNERFVTRCSWSSVASVPIDTCQHVEASHLGFGPFITARPLQMCPFLVQFCQSTGFCFSLDFLLCFFSYSVCKSTGLVFCCWLAPYCQLQGRFINRKWWVQGFPALLYSITDSDSCFAPFHLKIIQLSVSESLNCILLIFCYWLAFMLNFVAKCQ